MVMRPAHPPQGREQFLKLHPVNCNNFPSYSDIDTLEYIRFVPGVKTRVAHFLIPTHSVCGAHNASPRKGVVPDRSNFGCYLSRN